MVMQYIMKTRQSSLSGLSLILASLWASGPLSDLAITTISLVPYREKG
jgi:hypothetical protein